MAAIDHHTTRQGGTDAIDHARVTGDPPADVAMEPLMTADEVAAALGVHRKFVYARHHSGALRGYKLGPHYRFRPADVRAFLEASLAPADAAPRAARRASVARRRRGRSARCWKGGRRERPASSPRRLSGALARGRPRLAGALGDGLRRDRRRGAT